MQVPDPGGAARGSSLLSGLHVLVLSLSKEFADDWQSVLVNVGASVTKRIRPAPLLRDPDVIVTDSRAPRELCEVTALTTSVADPDPGSGAFLTPGSVDG